jgi:fused signal recognition particle receptor
MSWFQKLKSGLQKSSSKITSGIEGIFTKRKIDAATLDELEELLIQSDLGPHTSAKIIAEFAKNRVGKDADINEIKSFLSAQIQNILEPIAQKIIVPENLNPPKNNPFVILVVGVNGNGKTTTIGKLASQFKAQGKKVVIAACDTFRAAAVEQLDVWAQRAQAEIIKPEIIKGEQGAEKPVDAASVAFKALEHAQRTNADILLIDTAGRLHNKKGLMDELAKISRVLKKIDETLPHETILVLDSTTGQNALAQVEAFKELANISGLVVTKLDGTAKGGVVVALADKFKLPVYAIGVGEAIDDLKDFNAKEFADNLLGV